MVCIVFVYLLVQVFIFEVDDKNYTRLFLSIISYVWTILALICHSRTMALILASYQLTNRDRLGRDIVSVSIIS